MTRKRIFSWFFVSLLVLWEAAVFTLPVQPVSADETLFNSQTGMAELGTVYGHTKTDIRVIIGNIITIALGFLALLFLVLTLIAGFQYMTSGGNEEKTRTARKHLTNALIGLVIVLMAWAITRFILRRLAAAINNNVDLLYPY